MLRVVGLCRPQQWPFGNLRIFKGVEYAIAVLFCSWLDRITLLRLTAFPNIEGYVCLKTVYSRVCFPSNLYIQGYIFTKLSVYSWVRV